MRLSIALLLGVPLVALGQPSESPRPTPGVTIESAMVRLIDQVEVPARDNGVLVEVSVREGRLVKRGDLLARIDDRQPKIELQRAEFERDIAARKSDNDVAIRAAVKSQEVAETELRRATEARKAFKESVSQTEIDSLRLKAERAALDAEQAREDRGIAGITKKVKENEIDAAKAIVEQRLVIAPWDGMVVQVHRRAGDWMTLGEKVVRLVRLDKLRVEAFIRAADLALVQSDSPVRFVLTVEKKPVEFQGTVVFISPELDPVNEQIRIFAEIDNPDFKLRPGQKGKLIISPATKTARK